MEMLGDFYELVLHIYASGSQIDKTLKQQTKTEIAATSEDEVDAAAEDDPNPDDGGEGDGGDGGDDSDIDGLLGSLGNSTSNDTTNGATSGGTNGASNSATNGATNGAANGAASAPVASVVKTSSTFNYIACEADSATSRTLSSLSWSGTNLTVERCAAYCSEYKYMGVEFGSQ